MKNMSVRRNLINGIFAMGILLVAGAFLIELLGRKNNGFGYLQIGAIGLGLMMILFSWAIGREKVLFYVGKVLVILTWGLFALGTLLMAINISGLFLSLRTSAVVDGINVLGKLKTPSYSAQEVAKVQDKRLDETVGEYAYRLTHLIYMATIPIPDKLQNDRQFQLQVPIHENFILWLFGFTKPNTYGYYQYCDSSKGIERGVVSCGQATRIVKYIWLENGMRARRVTLDGHIVIEVQIDKEERTWWVLDPLYDIVFEHDMKTLSKQPELAVDAYLKAGYPTTVAHLYGGLFSSSGNYVITEENYCRVEQKYYFYKWAFPVACLIPSLLLVILRRKREIK
jgi:hypothetical protein